jgi:hypothetical protein
MAGWAAFVSDVWYVGKGNRPAHPSAMPVAESSCSLHYIRLSERACSPELCVQVQPGCRLAFSTLLDGAFFIVVLLGLAGWKAISNQKQH